MDDRFLEEAAAIGDRLARAAIVHADRCNWITRAIPYLGTDNQELLPELAPLNPSVYSGTAGMALFFARLATFTGSAAHRETARLAMNHAVHHAWYTAESSPVGRFGGEWRFGFYLGTLGVAWTAHEVGRLLGEQAHEAAARRLVAELAATTAAPKETDVMFGLAGAVPTLLDLAEAGLPGARDLALALGEDLLASAHEETDGTLSWGHRHATGGRNLTGFSHGAAGGAWALARLFAETGETRHAEAAARAVRYERAAFDPDAGNWPDFQLRPGPDGKHRCSTAWCHGAPGIGLSRVLAHPHLKDDALLDEARTACAATRKLLAAQLAAPGRDFMLCHGVAGHAECLWLVEEALGVAGAAGRARAVARYGLERYGEAPRRTWGDAVWWPTPVAAGEYPPLVTGVAGIAHFLLRVHDPRRVPTVLVPGGGPPSLQRR